MSLDIVPKIQEQLLFIEENVRLYDVGRTDCIDRYTAVFMHKVDFKTKKFTCLCMSAHPYANDGVIVSTQGHPGRHLGKRISYGDLPQDCQRLLCERLF